MPEQNRYPLAPIQSDWFFPVDWPVLDFSCNWHEGQLCALILVSGTTECFSGAPIFQWAI
jgi:hypothetical protein